MLRSRVGGRGLLLLLLLLLLLPIMLHGPLTQACRCLGGLPYIIEGVVVGDACSNKWGRGDGCGG